MNILNPTPVIRWFRSSVDLGDGIVALMLVAVIVFFGLILLAVVRDASQSREEFADLCENYLHGRVYEDTCYSPGGKTLAVR